MASEFIMSFVIEALDGSVLDGAVHPLDLAIGPRMLRLGETVIDVVAGAGHFEGVSPEELLTCDHLLDLGQRPTLAIREVDAVVRENGVNLIGNGFDEVAQEVCCNTGRDSFVQFSIGELGGSIDRHKKVKLALGGVDLGYVDMEIADWIGLELALDAFAVLHIRQP
jgi:hypothetical protein